ncbi:MAG: cupin domain-containing protein [Desulfurococcaceae archaeon]|uniref:Cupin domain-containing protein n=1 Tax=Staphylothermus marinus TaxID=2280 RepID=A0A7C4HGI9_STAMA
MINVKGACGEIVSHIDLVEKKKVSEDSAEKTWIKWLFSDRDGALTFAVRVFEIEPGGWIKPHSHPWEHGIYVLEGVGDVRIGSRVYRVTSGSYLYIPPNVEHEYRVVGDKSVKFICIIPLKPSVQESVKKEC